MKLKNIFIIGLFTAVLGFIPAIAQDMEREDQSLKKPQTKYDDLYDYRGNVKQEPVDEYLTDYDNDDEEINVAQGAVVVGPGYTRGWGGGGRGSWYGGYRGGHTPYYSYYKPYYYSYYRPYYKPYYKPYYYPYYYNYYNFYPYRYYQYPYGYNYYGW